MLKLLDFFFILILIVRDGLNEGVEESETEQETTELVTAAIKSQNGLVPVENNVDEFRIIIPQNKIENGIKLIFDPQKSNFQQFEEKLSNKKLYSQFL